jgi:hypothetical protein
MMGVMHNGVISGYGEKKGYCQQGEWDPATREYKKPEQKEEELKLSDTQEFLIHLALNKGIRNRVTQLDAATLRMIEMTTLDRWAWMNANGKVRMLGSWEQKDGLWFSNLSWVPIVVKREEKYTYPYYERGCWQGGKLEEAEDLGVWLLESEDWVRRGKDGKETGRLKADGTIVEMAVEGKEEKKEEWERGRPAFGEEGMCEYDAMHGFGRFM